MSPTITLEESTLQTFNLNELLQELMERIKDKDREAFSDLYSKSSDRVYSVALRLLRNSSLAEEIVQETYLQIWQEANSYDSSKGKVFSWILTLCHRRSVDRIRHEESRKNREEKYINGDIIEKTTEFSDDLCSRVDATMVHKNLENLSEKQSEILKLIYFDCKTVNEAAEELSITVSTAKTRLRDGLNKLRKELRSEKLT